MATTGVTTAMQAFINSNPDLAKTGQARDNNAQTFLGNLMYETYDQGSPKVIALRAKAASITMPPHSGRLGKRGKTYCDICDDYVSKEVQHNRIFHIKDASESLFCPVGTCDVSIHCAQSAEMDDHLANAHQFFCNMAGRGGDLLENTKKASILCHLNKATALYVLAEDRLKAEAILEEKGRLLTKLQEHNMTLPALQRKFPSHLSPDYLDLDEESMTKARAVELIVKLRKEMNKWYNIFIQAEDLLEHCMDEDNVEDQQDTQDDSRQFQGPDIESEEE